jgi:hypothetical protein
VCVKVDISKQSNRVERLTVSGFEIKCPLRTLITIVQVVIKKHSVVIKKHSGGEEIETVQRTFGMGGVVIVLFNLVPENTLSTVKLQDANTVDSVD